MGRETHYYTEDEYIAMAEFYRDTVLVPYNLRAETPMLFEQLESQLQQDAIRLAYLTTYYGMPAVMDGIREEARQGKVNTIWIEQWLEKQEKAQ